MSRSDFVAHQGLSGVGQTDVHVAIAAAEAKANRGPFAVVITQAGTILVLPEMSVSLRKDVAQVIYDTEGYHYNVAGRRENG